MTSSSVKTAAIEALLASRSLPFAAAQRRLEDARRALADLNSVGTQATSSRAQADKIDEQLYDEAWTLVDRPALSLADLVVKARFVQEMTQSDEGDLESQIAHSLCRDVMLLALALSSSAEAEAKPVSPE